MIIFNLYENRSSHESGLLAHKSKQSFMLKSKIKP